MGNNHKPNIVAFITSRSASTRLPDKALLDIHGRPMLVRVFDAVRESKFIDKVVVATVEGDDKIINLCKEYSIDYYAGKENDIVDRIYQAAKQFEAGIIVRVWGDQPLIYPDGIDEVIQDYHEDKVEYVCRIQPGQSVAVLGYKTLEDCWHGIKLSYWREQFHKYMLESNNYSAMILPYLDKTNYTVDTQYDLDRAREVWLKLNR